ncbi:MAG: hypothetical protein R2695_17580 [Acidimicrobiales bacterium]
MELHPAARRDRGSLAFGRLLPGSLPTSPWPSEGWSTTTILTARRRAVHPPSRRAAGGPGRRRAPLFIPCDPYPHRPHHSGVEPCEIAVVEGIPLFSFESIREQIDYTVFLDVPEPVRLERRIRRDVAERGRHADDVRRQFAATVKPMHDAHVQPSCAHARRVVGVDEAARAGRGGTGGTRLLLSSRCNHRSGCQDATKAPTVST